MTEVIKHPTLNEAQLLSKIESLISELKERIFDITSVNFKNPNCIDGRDTNNTRPSIPGGGLGALGVILSSVSHTDVDLRTVGDEVKRYFGGNLTGHTDDSEANQHDPAHQCQGCGHVERLVHQGERFEGMTNEISEIMKVESDSVAHTHLDTLKDGHLERNVIIVDVAGKGVIANGPEGQDFVYNKGYARDLYTDIIAHLHNRLGINLDIEEVMKIADQHFMTTGGDLAQNKDVFLLTDVDKDGTPKLGYYATLPEKQAA